MSNPLRVAVIGSGAMGKGHVEAWLLAGHRVVSVCDMNRQAAQELAAKFQVERIHEQVEEAVAQTDVDVVSICLPLKFHASTTVLAAKQGKHVFCEKPLASTFAETALMEEAVGQAGVSFGVGFQRNLANDIKVWKQRIEEGALGRPLVFNSDVLGGIRPKIAMHDKNGNKGPLMDICCHYMMMWQTVFQAKAKRVFARGHIFAEGAPELSSIAELAYDTSTFIVEYESGDVAAMTISWGLPKGTKIPRHADRIIGPKGGTHKAGATQIGLHIGDRTETIELEADGNLLCKQFQLFAESIRQGTPFSPGFQEGKDALAVTLAAFRSIESGRNEPVVYQD